jgi:hypothetical protein
MIKYSLMKNMRVISERKRLFNAVFLHKTYGKEILIKTKLWIILPA